MFIRHIFISGIELSYYKVSLRSANRAGGASSLKTEKLIPAVAICIAKVLHFEDFAANSFEWNILAGSGGS
jgi:hypothetical protein